MTVNPTLSRDRGDKEYTKFANIGTRKELVRVNDVTIATNVLAISAESFTLGAGAQGTTGVTKTDKAPVYNATGTHLGEVGDSGFAWVTGTILTTEVAYRYDQTDAVQLAALGNGEFAIDYDTGRIRYCKDTAGTTDTANYGSRMLNVDITGVEDIEIGAVEIKDADSDVRAEVHGINTAAMANGLNVSPAHYLASPGSLTDTYSSPLLLGLKGQLLTNIFDGTTTAAVDATSSGLLVTKRQNVTAATSSALDLTDGSAANRRFDTTFTKAWRASAVYIVFSTSQARDVTISHNDGSNLFTLSVDPGDTSTTYVFPPNFNWTGTATDEIRVQFSQAGGACNADVRILYEDA